MKTKIIYPTLAVIGLASFANAQEAPTRVSFRVISTFDCPGTEVVSTSSSKINDARDVVGSCFEASGAIHGFVRLSNGNYTAPIVEPNDDGGYTAGRGINNSRLICGEYLGEDALHGYFLTGRNYSEYDVPAFPNTSILGLNNVGDFAGGVEDATGYAPAFVNVGGNVTTFTVAGATSTTAYQINSSNQTEGYYVDTLGYAHAYWRDTDGTMHLVDFPGAPFTLLFGNNDSNWMVGRYGDSGGIVHGLFFVPPNRFFSFDYPGSSFTSFNGINAQGYICGRYLDDNSGIEHGIIVRVRIGAATSSAEIDASAVGAVSPVTPGMTPSLVRPLGTSRALW